MFNSRVSVQPLTYGTSIQAFNLNSMQVLGRWHFNYTYNITSILIFFYGSVNVTLCIRQATRPQKSIPRKAALAAQLLRQITQSIQTPPATMWIHWQWTHKRRARHHLLPWIWTLLMRKRTLGELTGECLEFFSHQIAKFLCC